DEVEGLRVAPVVAEAVEPGPQARAVEHRGVDLGELLELVVDLEPLGQGRYGHAVDLAQSEQAREGRQRLAVLDPGEVGFRDPFRVDGGELLDRVQRELAPFPYPPEVGPEPLDPP